MIIELICGIFISLFLLFIIFFKQVIQCLRKEITKSQSRDAENGPEYRQLLIKVFFPFFSFFFIFFHPLFFFFFSLLISHSFQKTPLPTTSQAIHNCAIRFPEVASNVVMILMDFLNDANVDSAVDVVLFLREVWF